MSTMMTLQAVPANVASPVIPASETDLVRATQAYVALVNARKQVHRLQRAAVLGLADDDALDAAVLAYRRARAHAARWLTPDDGLEPTQEELFATWLVEAAGPAQKAA
jgi:hypothetical protein